MANFNPKHYKTMKNLFKTMMLVAVAAMGFTACSNDTTADVAPEMEQKKVTMTITAENTRTYLDEANGKAQWKESGEFITAYQLIDDAEKASLVDSSEGAIADGKASFAVSFDAAEGANYVYSAIYPACNGVENSSEESLTNVKLNTPIIQKPSTTSFDSNADLMIAKVIEKTEQPTVLSMQFTRVVAIAKMSLIDMPTPDKLVNVTFEATGKILGGRSAFDVTTGDVVEYGYNSPSEKITLDYAENAIANDNAIYFTCLPVELAAGDTFTVTATTENNVKYTRTVTLGETAKLNFTAGNMSTFSVNMASATSENLASLAGEYAIIANANGALHVMGDAYSSNKYITQTEVVGTEIPEIYTTSDDQYIWIVEETSTNGKYYLKQKSTSKYVAYNSEDGNNPARLQDKGYALTITKNDNGSVNITSVDANTRNLRYNSSSPRFAFYTTAQTSIYLVPVGEDTTPRITAETEVSLTADECEDTITVTTKNVTGNVTATLGEDYDWFVAEIDEDGNLYYIAEANTTTESRKATVTLSAEGATDVVITFTQKAPAGVIEKITIDEFNKKDVDLEVYYELTGRITNIENPTYGNLTIEDETASVYVYGFTKEKLVGTNNDKSFGDLGLKVGDVVTLHAIRNEYNGKIQAGGTNGNTSNSYPAYYISHYNITATTDNTSIDAEGGDCTISVSSTGTLPTAITAILDDTSFAKLTFNDNTATVTFDENSTEDDRTATVTFTCGLAEQIVTFTQKAASTGDEPGESETITVSPKDITSNTGYGSYSNDTWIMTCGSGNGAFGSNKSNSNAKMKLGNNYVVATPLDGSITSNSIRYAAIISKRALNGIGKIVLAGSPQSGITVGITRSTDGTTWEKVQDFTATTTKTFTFDAKTAYYAIVIKAANKEARWQDFSATFSGN